MRPNGLITRTFHCSFAINLQLKTDLFLSFLILNIIMLREVHFVNCVVFSVPSHDDCYTVFCVFHGTAALFTPSKQVTILADYYPFVYALACPSVFSSTNPSTRPTPMRPSYNLPSPALFIPLLHCPSLPLSNTSLTSSPRYISIVLDADALWLVANDFKVVYGYKR